MMSKPKPVVGQILYDLNVGNAARSTRPQVLTQVVVANVGRKYFRCAPVEGSYRPETTYHIEDWRPNTVYSAAHRLFKSSQEWEDEKEAAQIYEEIRKEFGHYGPCNIPLETLRVIRELIIKARNC